MNARNWVFAMAIASLVAYEGRAAEAESRPVSNADTVVAVYTDSYGGAASHQPRLVLAVWKDGHIVWSDDRLRGGAPYRAGQIDPKRLASLLSDLERIGLFGEEELARSYVGPDAAFTTILIHNGARRIAMRSWHELYESNGTVVALADGLMALEHRSLFKVLKDQPADYLFFRYVWSEVRGRTAALVPCFAQPTSGELVMEHRIVSWHETPVPGQGPGSERGQRGK